MDTVRPTTALELVTPETSPTVGKLTPTIRPRPPLLLVAIVIKASAILSGSTNPQETYAQLAQLRTLIASLLTKSPPRNGKAVTIVVIHALLLCNRMANTHRLSPLPDTLAQSPSKMFLAALALAEACLMDTQTSARVWARVAGCTAHEVVELKKTALVYLAYSVHVDSKEFAGWCQVIMRWMSLQH
ncbi:hypothetical protein BC830DRAFT_1223606 [Chytriomyces sp. MP71]|nr:hypothetical protein BC830DRAFT_1223606 [Chytriomyces sp. MP71]